MQYVPPSEENEIKTNLSAKIKSIGFFGEMKILFNETIKVDFNYSELNSSCVDIKIENLNHTVKNWTL